MGLLCATLHQLATGHKIPPKVSLPFNILVDNLSKEVSITSENSSSISLLAQVLASTHYCEVFDESYLPKVLQTYLISIRESSNRFDWVEYFSNVYWDELTSWWDWHQVQAQNLEKSNCSMTLPGDSLRTSPFTPWASSSRKRTKMLVAVWTRLFFFTGLNSSTCRLIVYGLTIWCFD